MTLSSKNKTVPCPFCGQEISARALVCPGCGSDESTGWSEKKYLDGIDIDEDFSYEDALEKEFGSSAGVHKKFQISWLAAIGAILLVVSLVLFLRGMF